MGISKRKPLLFFEPEIDPFVMAITSAERQSGILRAVLGSCPGLHLHLAAGVCMSITTYLDDFDADLETQRVLSVALEMTRVS